MIRKYTKALQYYQKAFKYFNKHFKKSINIKNSLSFLYIYYKLGITYKKLNNLSKSYKNIKTAMQINIQNIKNVIFSFPEESTFIKQEVINSREYKNYYLQISYAYLKEKPAIKKDVFTTWLNYKGIQNIKNVIINILYLSTKDKYIKNLIKKFYDIKKQILTLQKNSKTKK